MWPFTNFKAHNQQRLCEVLSQTKRFVESSEESIWSGLSPAEIAMDISIAISQIDKDAAFDVIHLKMLFAPTGPIQEIAIASDWSDNYLKLSSEFDSLIEKTN